MPPAALPSPEELAVLPMFERLPIDRIALVGTRAQAEAAAAELEQHPAWGFDTESKPTFAAGEASQGPHTVQLALPDRAFVFQLHDAGCRERLAALLARGGIVKAGFGLQDDRRRIGHKLAVDLRDVLDLDSVLRQRGWRRQMGVKMAVAVLFGERLVKSKRLTTSNWGSRTLSEAQLLYAANDAWAALRVYEALGRPASHG